MSEAVLAMPKPKQTKAVATRSQKIGVVGAGFVGSAVHAGFCKKFDVIRYDLDPAKSDVTSARDLVEKVGDGPIFVCVPTPVSDDGSCNTSIVEGCVAELAAAGAKLIIIKSTVQPGTTDRLTDKHSKVQICFNPEFLREATSVQDFKTQKYVLLGGSWDACQLAMKIYDLAFPGIQIFTANATVMEMVKYFINSFLATKVSFCNEIFQICNSLGIHYDDVANFAALDKRIGSSHTLVPGPDGEKGFGGNCLPKDISALMMLAHSLGIETPTMSGAWQTNQRARHGS